MKALHQSLHLAHSFSSRGTWAQSRNVSAPVAKRAYPLVDPGSNNALALWHQTAGKPAGSPDRRHGRGSGITPDTGYRSPDGGVMERSGRQWPSPV